MVIYVVQQYLKKTKNLLSIQKQSKNIYSFLVCD